MGGYKIEDEDCNVKKTVRLFAEFDVEFIGHSALMQQTVDSFLSSIEMGLKVDKSSDLIKMVHIENGKVVGFLPNPVSRERVESTQLSEMEIEFENVLLNILSKALRQPADTGDGVSNCEIKQYAGCRTCTVHPCITEKPYPRMKKEFP